MEESRKDNPGIKSEKSRPSACFINSARASLRREKVVRYVACLFFFITTDNFSCLHSTHLIADEFYELLDYSVGGLR